jgi:hemerythrin-like domain-containing protein
MPVQIGAKTHNFDNPTGLLSDCHRRVEMFLGSLAAAAAVIDRPPSEETRQSLTTALRYFAQSAPKHTADEEESLFPRLRRSHDSEMQAAFAKLEKLEDDHRWAEPLHAEVERLGAEYLTDEKLSDAAIWAFRDAVTKLQSMYKQHIGLEDELVFPLADRLLSESEKTAIAREMAARRDIPIVVPLIATKD